jgi:hypothetical protein
MAISENLPLPQWASEKSFSSHDCDFLDSNYGHQSIILVEPHCAVFETFS